MTKDCPKCGNVVEGQNVSSNGFFLTYICDECGYDFQEEKPNPEDCKHRKPECECEGCPNNE